MKSKNLKILLFFHGGSRNRGCEAIVRTAAQLLKSDERIQELALSSSDLNSDRIIPHIDVIHLDQPATLKKFSVQGLLSAVKVKLFKDESLAYRKIHESIIKLIPQYDIFLSIGGDNYCYGEQPGIYEIDRQIKKAGKKLVLWGASIGEEDLSEAKLKDLKSFDLLLVRESITERTLKKAGIRNVKLVADGAFLMEKTELPLPPGWQEGKTVGFNFSPLVIKKNPESKNAAIALVQHILDTTDFTVCFVPHVIISGNDDYEILQEFEAHFKDSRRTLLLPNDLNATEYKGYIGRMKFFIGARTHATIAAYSCLVPTMVLGYSVKSKGIAKDIFSTERLVLDLSEISDPVKLIARFEEMKAEEKELREILSAKVPELKRRAMKAKEFLLELK
ncbi:polysaccharide pyruvyl transferase family protein [Chryseobacterium gotjawalense]|uniref:Polysaccharide pyruvyl transferase family protein n=1 Tax=Chryseobacterium gotjawalense TaxID=3042315 RepID=A0ABY8REJ2_9FLAO|nr:polysaccharide pyruvyl transferase family protein [Chryseobacterium sp. wdc7]WHF51429.1 polysaccharide pyruvyl transferase family protein [Chryseobacterium sp. wdc7]